MDGTVERRRVKEEFDEWRIERLYLPESVLSLANVLGWGAMDKGHGRWQTAQEQVGELRTTEETSLVTKL